MSPFHLNASVRSPTSWFGKKNAAQVERALVFSLLCALLVFGGCVDPAWAQASSRAEVSGVITDPSQVPIPFATVQVVGTGKGRVADADGRFRIRLEAGSVQLLFRSLGHVSVTRDVQLRATESYVLNVVLPRESVPLGQITVDADRGNQDGSRRITTQSVKHAPALGEPDVIRTAAFLPGIVQTNDFTASLNVRGGASDQNQYLIDGVEVYDPRHLVGVFSAFNVWAFEATDVYTASFPVTHGGRLSGILDLKPRVPSDSATTNASVSLVSASAMHAQNVRGTGVLVAARRTYLDPVLHAVGSTFRYRFHDANVKLSRSLGRGVTAETFGFASRDALSTFNAGESEETSDWGGRMGAARLRHRSGTVRHALTASWVRSTTTVRRTDASPRVNNRLDDQSLDYRLTVAAGDALLKAGGGIQRYTLRYDWSGRRTGDRTIEDLFYPGVPLVLDTTSTQTLATGFASVQRSIGRRLWMTLGARGEGWTNGSLAWSPRAHASFRVSGSADVFATTGRYRQYVATGVEGTEDTVGEPLFLLREPQSAWTTTLGGRVDVSAAYQIWTEMYHRRFSNVARIDVQETSSEGTVPFRDESGSAVGVDVRVEKSQGRLTGQVAYSYLRTRVQTALRTTTADWSVPHTLQALVGAQIGTHWQIGLAGTVRSGVPYTPVVGRYVRLSPDLVTYAPEFVEGEPNSQRLPPYRRIDVSLRRQYPTSWGSWTLYVQAVNVLNTKNSLRVDWNAYYRFGTINEARGVQGSLPAIPTVGVEFAF